MEKHTLSIQVWSLENDDGYTAWLGNCITEGNTEQEALQNLENAIYDIFNSKK